MTMEKFHFTDAQGKDWGIPYLVNLPAPVVREFNRKMIALGREIGGIEDETTRGLLNMESIEIMLDLLESGIGKSSKEFKALNSLSWGEQQKVVSDWFSKSGGEGTPLARS